MGSGCEIRDTQLHPRVLPFPLLQGNMQRCLVCCWFFFFLRQIHFPKVNSIPSHHSSPTEFLSCLEQVKAGHQSSGKVLWRELCCIMQGRAANLLLPPPFAISSPQFPP